MAAWIVADEESCLHSLAVGEAHVCPACVALSGHRGWGCTRTCKSCTCRWLHLSNSNAARRGTFLSCRGAGFAWAVRCVGGRGTADLPRFGEKKVIHVGWSLQDMQRASERAGSAPRGPDAAEALVQNQTVSPLLLTIVLGAREGEKKDYILLAVIHGVRDSSVHHHLHSTLTFCPRVANLREPQPHEGKVAVRLWVLLVKSSLKLCLDFF